MYIVNTSFMVDPAVQTQWLDLVRKHYIPLIIDRGFARPVFTRVVSEEITEHFTYSSQTEAPDIPAYRVLTGEIFAEYAQIAAPLFGDKVVWFTSLLKKEDY